MGMNKAQLNVMIYCTIVKSSIKKKPMFFSINILINKITRHLLSQSKKDKPGFLAWFYLVKDLVIIAGRNENAVGKPLIYTTSKSFMDYFGINSADELPKIREVLADQIVEPTIVNPELQAAEEVVEVLEYEDEEVNAILVVSENGELIEEATEDDVPEEEIAETEEIKEESAEGDEPEPDSNTEEEDGSEEEKPEE